MCVRWQVPAALEDQHLAVVLARVTIIAGGYNRQTFREAERRVLEAEFSISCACARSLEGTSSIAQSVTHTLLLPRTFPLDIDNTPCREYRSYRISGTSIYGSTIKRFSLLWMRRINISVPCSLGTAHTRTKAILYRLRNGVALHVVDIAVVRVQPFP